MRAIAKLGLMLGGAAVALAAGCLVTPDDLTERACAGNGDCPGGYACEVVSPAARGCVLQYPLPDDGGGQGGPYTGPARYYCSDIKPLLDFYCISCHGSKQQNGGDFRLDFYPNDGGTRGAYAMAAEIKYRAALAQTMPPQDAGAFPSDSERLRFYEWADGGALGCPRPDAGSDAGTDGGTKDAGYYATQIQPIFTQYCSACHSWTYSTLVNVPASCNTGTAKVRVSPSDAGGSLLYLKITNDPAKCGASMPKGQTPLVTLDPAATTKIRNWITTGADAN